ncbi:extensin family protein [Phyllobacterium zundukense]|uniref:Extensin family protein n=1 Tax=Phyllobacterium zundukense TaxID=1867719 RepID=A0ACD4D0W3_9HYPH|nr:extensin family protein [Phyllobacterium zundukense]UXN59486.1 extensin family protein [Phyllobacterium zundukense]
MSIALSSAARFRAVCSKHLSIMLVLFTSTALSSCGMGDVRRPMADVGSNDTSVASQSLASEESTQVTAEEIQQQSTPQSDDIAAQQPEVLSVPDAEPQPDRIIVPETPQVAEPKPYSLPESEPASDDAESYGYAAGIRDPIARGESAFAMSGSEIACRTQLKQLGVVFQEREPINDGGVCKIDHPLTVSGFSSGRIRLKPSATLNCQMTLAFARWVKGDLAPSTRLRYLSGIHTIHQASSYSCRTMSSQRGRSMSEHSKGNALDISKITLNNGKDIQVQKPGWFSFRQRGLLNTVRSDACDYFSTVLGPGYDRFHRTHFHFDLMQRRSGRRACR